MTRASRVAVVDYGMGNLRSVVRALEAVGADTVVTSDPADIAAAARVVFPGQGAFKQCMDALDGTGMADALRRHWEAERPYLGICLGLQVLMDGSDEHGPVAGFGVVPGRVKRFAANMRDGDGHRLKVPHMGWNEIRWERDHALAEALGGRAAHGQGTAGDGDAGSWFYFVHSFFVVPEEPADVLATAEHGERFTVAVARGPMVGVQFHPEKSHAAGLALLRRFMAL